MIGANPFLRARKIPIQCGLIRFHRKRTPRAIMRVVKYIIFVIQMMSDPIQMRTEMLIWIYKSPLCSVAFSDN